MLPCPYITLPFLHPILKLNKYFSISLLENCLPYTDTYNKKVEFQNGTLSPRVRMKMKPKKQKRYDRMRVPINRMELCRWYDT